MTINIERESEMKVKCDWRTETNPDCYKPENRDTQKE